MRNPWLFADNIAAHLGVTKDTVPARIAEKGMPAHKVGRPWKFQASEVDEWVRGGSATSSSDGATSGRARLSVTGDTLSDWPTNGEESR